MGQGAEYPGWTALKQELESAVNSGEGITLSSVQAMTMLGAVAQRDARHEKAYRLLQQVHNGSSCWMAREGCEPCSPPGVEQFLDETPRRRWWRRRRSTSA